MFLYRTFKILSRGLIVVTIATTICSTANLIYGLDSINKHSLKTEECRLKYSKNSKQYKDAKIEEQLARQKVRDDLIVSSIAIVIYGSATYFTTGVEQGLRKEMGR